jgi:hypothetical protein
MAVNTPDREGLPSPATVLRWIARRGIDLLIVVALAALLGEGYLRSYLGRQHEYGPDPVLGARFRPGQETYRGRVNADGHRGPETDWSRPVLVGLGDSQAFGSGVADDAVWTSRLAALVNEQVVNAAHPGFGPYQQSVELRRLLARDRKSIEAILVRVSIEDRNFTPPAPETLPAIQADVEKRAHLRVWTRVVPFLANRIGQQWPAITSTLAWTSSTASRPADETIGASMWKEQSRWWVEMADRAGASEVPVIFFIHDPTDLASNRLLERRLRETLGDRQGVRVVRLDSRAWGLRPGSPEQLWQQYHDRYTLQHDHHGNEAHHERVAQVLAVTVRGLLDRTQVRVTQPVFP